MECGRLLLSLLITLAVSAADVWSAAMAGGRCVSFDWLWCRLREGRVRRPGDVCTPMLHSGPHRPPARGTPSAGTGLVGSATLLPIILCRLGQPPEEPNGMEASSDISHQSAGLNPIEGGNDSSFCDELVRQCKRFWSRELQRGIQYPIRQNRTFSVLPQTIQLLGLVLIGEYASWFLRSLASGPGWMISVSKERNVERGRSMHEENRREGQETGGIICKTDKKTQILGT